MVIGEKLVFFELQKTGGTHIRNIFIKVLKDNHHATYQHNTHDSVSTELMGDFENKVKVGSIRNPWDWYVSYWSFCCMKKGQLYRYTVNEYDLRTKKGLKRIWDKARSKNIFQSAKEWKPVYSDPHDAGNFQKWLKMMISDEKMSIGEHYKESPISKSIGFLTFLYIKLFTYNGRRVIFNLKNFDELNTYDQQNNFMDIVIRNEDIHTELLDYADQLYIDKQQLQNVITDFSKSKTNRSVREENYRNYYNEESRQLVAEKEKLIIEKYGYQF